MLCGDKETPGASSRVRPSAFAVSTVSTVRRLQMEDEHPPQAYWLDRLRSLNDEHAALQAELSSKEEETEKQEEITNMLARSVFKYRNAANDIAAQDRVLHCFYCTDSAACFADRKKKWKSRPKLCENNSKRPKETRRRPNRSYWRRRSSTTGDFS